MGQDERVDVGVQWLPWNADAFARARAGRKPILLWVTTTWSEGCREMARACYADPAVAALIEGHFVPIRVDADERPDIADRHDLGGLPTTAFLSPDGALLGGGTFVPRERLQAGMQRVIEAMDRPLPPMAPPALPEDADGEPDGAALATMVFETFDAEHGGFGGVPRFPLVAPVRLALRLHAETGDPVMLDYAGRTLDGMGWGGLYDTDCGGFFRYCARGDWSEPRREKLLPTNAALLDLYAEAGAQTGCERWLARAANVAEFMETRLRRRDGAWRIADGVHGGRVFSDATAVAASAMLHASNVLDDGPLAARAIDALEHVLLSTYRPGEGLAHCGGGVRGLLTDHVSMAAALLDASEASGRTPYAMMAEELMRHALRTMWDEDRGGFFDRMPETGLGDPRCVARPLKPFALNCDAAIVLTRMGEASGDREFSDRAAETLRAVASAARSQGPLAAHYLLARRAARPVG